VFLLLYYGIERLALCWLQMVSFLQNFGVIQEVQRGKYRQNNCERTRDSATAQSFTGYSLWRTTFDVNLHDTDDPDMTFSFLYSALPVDAKEISLRLDYLAELVIAVQLPAAVRNRIAINDTLNK
jgi:hypothetical protein